MADKDKSAAEDNDRKVEASVNEPGAGVFKVRARVTAETGLYISGNPPAKKGDEVDVPVELLAHLTREQAIEPL